MSSKVYENQSRGAGDQPPASGKIDWIPSGNEIVISSQSNQILIEKHLKNTDE